MKKLMVASAIAMIMAAGSAMASQGDVKFFGNVSAVTCDVTPSIDGNVTDLVQLGTVAPQGEGEAKDIIFKATDISGGQCGSLTSKTASIAWTGELTAEGIGAQSGVAQDAYVILTPVNGQGSEPIKASHNVATFDAGKLATEGFKFSAKLKGGNTAGDFQTAAAYAITYQ
ncbi:fimbrial protein [Escherichia albertii]|nr:fimbrial protein [Escherichia albertii]MCZ9050025.1 fimbrial protein [Escherichia albertii]